jgi:hypothetical protein
MGNLHPRLQAAALAAYMTTIIIAEAGRRGFPISGDEGSAITGALALLAGWLQPPGGSDGGADK